MFIMLLLIFNCFSSTDKELNLKAIRVVESNDGKNTNHLSINKKSVGTAMGRYGITPILVIDYVKNNAVKYSKFKHLIKESHLTSVKAIETFCKYNKESWLVLEDMIAIDYYNHITRVFGKDLSLVAYAWLNGIEGTKRALSSGIDIYNHWHVLKVIQAKKQLSMTK